MFYILKEPEGKTFHVNTSLIAYIECSPSDDSGSQVVAIKFSGGESVQVTMSEAECARFFGSVESTSVQ